MTKNIKKLIASLVLGATLVTGVSVSIPHITAQADSRIPSVYYEHGVYWYKGSWGKIITDSEVVSTAAYSHPDRNGFPVTCMVRSFETPSTKDDMVVYYRFSDSKENIPCNNW